MSDRPRKFGGGRYPAKFSYSYQDLAEVLGCSVGAARKHAQRGNFDPNNLVSILEFIKGKLGTKDEIVEQDSSVVTQHDSRVLVRQIEAINKKH